MKETDDYEDDDEVEPNLLQIKAKKKTKMLRISKKQKKINSYIFSKPKDANKINIDKYIVN